MSTTGTGAAHAALWSPGPVNDFGTLGGENSAVEWPVKNNHGLVVGISKTAIPNPNGEKFSCDPAFIATHGHSCVPLLWQNGTLRALRGRAVGPGVDQKRILPPYPGDSTAAATAINDAGQAVGISGDCGDAVGAFSARHARLLESGRPMKLPTLGGAGWNTQMAINNLGSGGQILRSARGCERRSADAQFPGVPLDG